MSVARSQQQVFLRLLRSLQPHWHRDLSLPRRIQQLLSGERAFGSRDRRLYRELIYTTLRYLPWIEPVLAQEPERAAAITAWLAADTRDTQSFRAELCGDWPTVSALAERAVYLTADPSALLPAWCRDECPAVFSPAELEAQLARAPLWLRLQTDQPALVEKEFAANGWRTTVSPQLSTAWRVHGEVDITRSTAYSKGLVEVQDLGSQFVLESLGLGPGGQWLDACAGAGGKTLQLSRLVGPDGTVEAHDIRAAALDELLTRAERAGLENIRTVEVPRSAAYDGVLVDAPCSGSGTWRRSPHLKWTTTPELIREKTQLQQDLLAQFAQCVRPGGRLVYATCSLSHRENADVVAAFLASHREFKPERLSRTFDFTPDAEAITILPARHNTDGFFVASLRRR